MRNVKTVALIGLALIALGMPAPDFIGRAQGAPAAPQTASATLPTDLSAQRRFRRRATPIYIYGHRPLAPTAVRSCYSWYAQEYRPSGTVIVPHMRCHWIDG
jgi:hypothetical protein